MAVVLGTAAFVDAVVATGRRCPQRALPIILNVLVGIVLLHTVPRRIVRRLAPQIQPTAI